MPGIVERARAHANEARKSFEREMKRGSAVVAEVQRDALVAAVRAMVVGTRRGSTEDDILDSEDRFDEERRPGDPLAKGAMAYRNAERLGGSLVADLAAQAAPFMRHRHGIPIEMAAG